MNPTLIIAIAINAMLVSGFMLSVENYFETVASIKHINALANDGISVKDATRRMLIRATSLDASIPGTLWVNNHKDRVTISPTNCPAGKSRFVIVQEVADYEAAGTENALTNCYPTGDLSMTFTFPDPALQSSLVRIDVKIEKQHFYLTSATHS